MDESRREWQMTISHAEVLDGLVEYCIGINLGKEFHALAKNKGPIELKVSEAMSDNPIS
jgi:hypothetical protein